MGSSNSRLGSSPSTPGLKRRLLSSLFCGASVSHAPVEVGDDLSDSSTPSLQNLALCHGVSVSSKQHSSSTFGFETGPSNSAVESGAFTGSPSNPSEDTSAKLSFANHSDNLHLHSRPVNVDDNLSELHVPETSSKDYPAVESLSTDAPLTTPVAQNTGILHSDGDTIEDATMDSNTPHSASLVTSSPLPSFLLSFGQHNPVGMGVLLVEVVSIHSNIFSSSIAEISNREARRNSRRMLWDAFSRNSFRRNNDSSTTVFTTSHSHDLGSHDRWLLDFSGDLHYVGVGHESRYSATRSDPRSGPRWQSRYEMSERFRDVHDEQGWQCSSCTTGLRHVGTCSCDSSFIAEESGIHARFLQIIMLADALVEVLDEIHSHRMSLSLSTLTLPAPESVVNSFPLKNYKKLCGTESRTQDLQQCHICLVDYEEGDKIRVLPCSHEYHMSCVDKWLKEIHGICPLCRNDVCKGVAEGSTSASEIPSL